MGGMTATRPQPRTIEGRYVRLSPLVHDELAELFLAIGNPTVFAGGFGGGPSGYRDTADAFVEWAAAYFQIAAGNVYGIRLIGGPHDGELVGTSTLTEFDESTESAHLGWTAYDPRVWGTVVNAEAKLLILSEAFENGFGRVKLQADVRNERSRAAIAKLGATSEGIMRRHVKRADGSWRDSAIFSITVDDWPRVSASLRERVERQDGRPVLYRSVS
jgi:RimJ/RimL family protein N-acetyltransferase